MTDSMAPNLVAAVDEARHWDRLMQMAVLGGFTDPLGHAGVNRACPTALEAVQALREAGHAPGRPIEAVAWTNEEGGRFAPGCMGSMAYAGPAAGRCRPRR